MYLTYFLFSATLPHSTRTMFLTILKMLIDNLYAALKLVFQYLFSYILFQVVQSLHAELKQDYFDYQDGVRWRQASFMTNSVCIPTHYCQSGYLGVPL